MGREKYELQQLKVYVYPEHIKFLEGIDNNSALIRSALDDIISERSGIAVQDIAKKVVNEIERRGLFVPQSSDNENNRNIEAENTLKGMTFK